MFWFHKILLVLLAFTCCCQKKTDKEKKPVALTSVVPYKCLVKKIAGDSLDVITIVPEKKSIHHFSPTAKQIAVLGASDLFFQIGEPFENQLISSFKQKNPLMEIVDLKKDVPLIPIEYGNGHTHSDLHLWLSINNLKIQAKTIVDVLEKKYPVHKTLYRKNFLQAIKELNALDLKIKKIFTPKKTRAFITSHPAFNYFCKEYDCLQIPIEYHGKNPTLRQLENTLNFAKEKQAKMVLLIPQENNKGAKLIAKNLKLKTHFFNPLFCDFEKNLLRLANLIQGKDEHN